MQCACAGLHSAAGLVLTHDGASVRKELARTARERILADYEPGVVHVKLKRLFFVYFKSSGNTGEYYLLRFWKRLVAYNFCSDFVSRGFCHWEAKAGDPQSLNYIGMIRGDK